MKFTLLGRVKSAHEVLGKALQWVAPASNRKVAERLGVSTQNVHRAFVRGMTLERMGDWLNRLSPDVSDVSVVITVRGGFVTVELPLERPELLDEAASYKVLEYRDEEGPVFTVLSTDEHGENRDLLYAPGGEIRTVDELVDEIINQCWEAYDIDVALSLIAEAEALRPARDQ